jgi:hypothetical protein
LSRSSLSENPTTSPVSTAGPAAGPAAGPGPGPGPGPNSNSNSTGIRTVSASNPSYRVPSVPTNAADRNPNPRVNILGVCRHGFGTFGFRRL